MVARSIPGSARFGFSRVSRVQAFLGSRLFSPFRSHSLFLQRGRCAPAAGTASRQASGCFVPRPVVPFARFAPRPVGDMPNSYRARTELLPGTRQTCTRNTPATRRPSSATRRFGIPFGSRPPPKSSEAPSACSMAHVGQGHAKGAPASVRLPDRSVIRFRRACTSRIRTACRRSRLPWGGA